MIRKFFARFLPKSEQRSLRDISVYSDAVNSLVSLANVSTTAGEAINERTAISLVSVYGAIRNIADDIGKMEKAVFRKLPRGKVQIFDHPLHKIMCQSPNPEMGPMDFFRALIGSACLFGNGYARIVRDRYTGEAIHAYPIHPWRVRNLRDNNGMEFIAIDGITTVRPGELNGRVELGDMIHIKNFGTNGNLGIMTIRSAKESLGLTLALERYGAAFFGNQAVPKGVFYSDLPLDPETRDAYKKEWEKHNRGAGRAHGTAWLPHGVKWQQQSIANNEGQFLETRSYQLLDVCRLFRLPPHKLMDVSKGTMNNMEQQNGEYVQDCLMSWIEVISQELKRKLCRPDEVTIFPRFLTRSFFRGDIKTRQEFYASGIQWGYLSRNDVREMEDLNPVDGLDTYLVPQNYSAAEALETVPRSRLLMLAAMAKSNGVPLDENGFPLLAAPKEDLTADDEQADPAEQVTPEVNVPPPPGIVIPGTQPIDDSFFGRCKPALDVQKALLGRVLTRYLRIETDKVIRASKKGNLAEWVERFYAGHTKEIGKAIAPSISGMAETVWAAGGIAPTVDMRAKVQQFITDSASKHIADSRADLTEAEGVEQRVSGWDTRADAFAEDRVSELLLLLKTGAK